MLPHWISLLFSASLFVLSASSLKISQAGQQAPTYTATLGTSAKCLSEVNSAREAAGLPSFTDAPEGKKLIAPKSNLDEDEEWKKVCMHLIPTEQTEAVAAANSENPFKDGTYAFKSLTAAEPNCKETVDHWKAAFKSFTGLPPSKTQGANLYKNQDNVSFVALYNPSSDATADCRVVTCTKTTAGGTVLESDSDQSPEYGYALICKTMPSAFADEDSAPFTQDQWDKVVSSLTGSASTAIPGFCAFFIAVFSLIAL
ncbi:SAG family member [Eimeria necatrix]|uniref:SAG family member n=1 Tax=Eimeria necatrix TaxID=51315 RepID=U6MLR5_9EIME|nr:SAG family member [Eimeria necatrix]CDJ62575.1 SAG family member [Eimeria necatrix]